MPREVRKRGKKHKKSQHQALPEGQTQEQEDHHPNNSSEPSWIVSAREAEDVHPEAPFGYVGPDFKAYFRTVDEQIQSWQEDGTQPVDEDGDFDPNEGVCIPLNTDIQCLLVVVAILKQNVYSLLRLLVRCQGKRDSFLQIQIVPLSWREWHIQWMTLCCESLWTN